MHQTLLRTKLYVPSIRPNLVPRPQLIARLSEGVQLGHKLTLISAPAGFGKTTLVSEWINQKNQDNDHPFNIAWLSLDENDNDLTRFLTYLIAALNNVEGIETPIGQAAQSMLQAPPSDEILISLINEIATLPDNIILILDDYHLVDSPSVDNALAFLIDHLPPQLHLVIATREDPQLSLARLRARSQLTELRAADLRFTSAESVEFLTQVMGLDLSAENIATLEQRTEGWITGLQLAAISMRGREDVAGFIKSFAGSHRFVLDYLIEEVLDQLPQTTRDFLLTTCILDRLTGSLCDAVRIGFAQLPGGSDDIAGQENGQIILEMLDQTNQFIIPLDNERQWYRYHHLFAEVLRTRLIGQQPNQIATLHLRASGWYEHHDLPSDAIHHALAAQDFERAAALAERVWPAWNFGYRSIAWLDRVKLLPEALVRVRPVLSLAYAWAYLNAGKLEDAESKLKDVERWLEPPDFTSIQPQASSATMVVVDQEQFRTLPLWLATARAYHAQAIGDIPGAVKHVKHALHLFPEEDQYNRAALTGLLGLAYWTSGDLEAAYKVFSDGLFQNDHDLIKGTFILADMKLTLGQLREAIQSCEHALRLAAEYVEPNPIGTEDIYTAISDLHRERGDFERAAQELATSRKLGEQVELPDWEHRWCIAQARLKASLGDLDSAADLLDEAARLYVRTPVPYVRPIAAMKTRVWVQQGKLAESLNWAQEQHLSTNDDLGYLHEFEHVTLVRIFIAQYSSTHVERFIDQALGLIERLLKAAEDGGRAGSLIEILVLQALAFEALGKMIPALASLEGALTLAEPEGFVRIFLDEGPSMNRLLHAALNQTIAPDYVRRLLAAFSSDEPVHVDQSSLIEPLSERELELLQLIAEGLTNPQIAARLYLSLNTVKVHTRNIYGKLDVHSRTQAVARARELEILPRF